MSPQDNPMSGPHAPAPEHQFYSLGFLCQMLQRLPPQIEAIADAAGVAPTMAVDGVAYYRGSDVVKMANHCVKLHDKVQEVARSN